MIGIIVCGHGHFATGITSTVELIAGKQEYYKAVDFNGSDDLSALLEQAVDDLTCEGLLFFTDILGGAPFREAALIARQKTNCEVISGVTPQMLIEACLERYDYDNLTESIIKSLIENAREGITSLSLQLDNKPKVETPSDDGI
ncbi:MAG: PTS galactosamine/N-acetylgalactosamine transporter subunit IIA [Ostreibacterium sp.]